MRDVGSSGAARWVDSMAVRVGLAAVAVSMVEVEAVSMVEVEAGSTVVGAAAGSTVEVVVVDTAAADIAKSIAGLRQ
jgi:hypothetical protein